MSNINHNPPGRRGSASSVVEKAIRASNHVEAHIKQIEGFIVDVFGPEGTAVSPGDRHFGSVWFQIALKNGKMVTVESEEDYGSLRSQVGSNANFRGKMCTISYSGNGLRAVSRGKAKICNHGMSFYNDEDITCSVFSMSASSGIVQEDASYNNKVSRATKADGE